MFSQSSCAWISSKSPYCERSPPWRRMSPSGREGFVLCVSEMQITKVMSLMSDVVGQGEGSDSP